MLLPSPEIWLISSELMTSSSIRKRLSRSPATRLQRRALIRRIKRSKDHPEDAEKVMQLILDGPGMAYAEAKMTAHRDRAVALLDGLPDGPAKSSLLQLVDFTITRRK